MSNWQPIETAPERTHILVYLDGNVHESSLGLQGWWFPFSEYHGCGCCGSSTDKPTHWMPLPAPPITEG